jgi:hypothetical protein
MPEGCWMTREEVESILATALAEPLPEDELQEVLEGIGFIEELAAQLDTDELGQLDPASAADPVGAP